MSMSSDPSASRYVAVNVRNVSAGSAAGRGVTSVAVGARFLGFATVQVPRAAAWDQAIDLSRAYSSTELEPTSGEAAATHHVTVAVSPDRETVVRAQSSRPRSVVMTFAEPGAKPPSSVFPS